MRVAWKGKGCGSAAVVLQRGAFKNQLKLAAAPQGRLLRESPTHGVQTMTGTDVVG
jgi:hypothetical protein